MLFSHRPSLLTAALGLLAPCLVASVSIASLGTHDFVDISSHPPPAGWQPTGRPSSSYPITLRIALSQPNLPQLEQHLLEISDPSHHRWREHLSKEEVDALSAPSDEGLEAVDAWLSRYGIQPASSTHSVYHSERSPAKDWITVPNIPILLAEELLNTTYFVFTHVSTGKKLVRTTSYSVPSFVATFVDVIQPTDLFGSTKSLAPGVVFVDKSDISFVDEKSATSKAALTPNITIQVLKDLYGTNGYKPSSKRSLLGLTG